MDNIKPLSKYDRSRPAGLIKDYEPYIRGLSPEQIAWRRLKIAEMGAELFRQEYPSNANEAFLAPSDSFISPELVMKARRAEVEPFGPLLIDVDPAGTGPDKTAIAWRRGHKVLKVERRRNLNTMQVAGWVATIIANDKPRPCLSTLVA